MVKKSDKLIECYRRNSRKYYERHKEEILSKMPKVYCEYCKKELYESYYHSKHVKTKKHITNEQQQQK